MINNDYLEMETGYSKEKTKTILSWIGSEKKVLDVGCFDGRDSLLIKNNQNEVIGMDKMQSALKKANQKGIKTYCLDLEKDDWPIENNYFDIVLACDIIEHLFDPDSFLDKINRSLKQNGLLIMTTPNLASVGRRILLLLGKNPYIEISKYQAVNIALPVGHLRYFTKDGLLKILNYHGFKIEKITADGFNLGPFKSIFLSKLFPTFSWRFILKARKK